MFKLKLFLQLTLNSSLGLIASLYISGCQPKVPSNTQIYEVNGATTCDHAKTTPNRTDDCDNAKGNTGYYYNAGSQSVFYRSNSGKNIVVERNRTFSGNTALTPGSLVPLQTPVITDANGSPLVRNGSVVKSLSPTSPTGTIRSTPIRSSATFTHPSLGRVSGGRTTSVGRGMSFGGRGTSG